MGTQTQPGDTDLILVCVIWFTPWMTWAVVVRVLVKHHHQYLGHCATTFTCPGPCRLVIQTLSKRCLHPGHSASSLSASIPQASSAIASIFHTPYSSAMMGGQPSSSDMCVSHITLLTDPMTKTCPVPLCSVDKMSLPLSLVRSYPA